MWFESKLLFNISGGFRRFHRQVESPLHEERKASEITHRKHVRTMSEKEVVIKMNLLIWGWANCFNHSLASRTFSGPENFVCFRLTQFIRYTHKLRYLPIDHRKLRSYGLLPLNGGIGHSCAVRPR